MRRVLSGQMFVLAWVAAFAMACDEGKHSGLVVITPDPQPGTTTFVSADDSQGPTNHRPPVEPSPGDNGQGGVGSEDGGFDDGDRTVEEGDIYRVLRDGKLLNFNSYRGLQIIDIADPTAPTIVGRLPLYGSPVELYVSGSRAYLLLNGWTGYYGGRDDIAVEAQSGGLLVSVDLSNPSSPREIDRRPIDGWIRTSRLARSGSQESLYVASSSGSYYGGWSGSSGVTVVDSFSLSEGVIAEVDHLALDGWISDIAATPRALLVARQDPATSWSSSTVSAIDISRPDGSMIPGAHVAVSGWVKNQFNLDLRGNILRVVSNDFSGSGVSVLETFDATDLQNLQPIAKRTFGEGEDLYATIFLDDAAFFVTYRRVDPFHAFAIDGDGIPTEKSEFIVSGWNDYFRPVSGDTRLIGIGVDDEGGGRRMAVSLYDITDLENPDPLLSRASVDTQWSWSEANWDHRGFSVLEGAVETFAADGTRETGLVLLPYSGWSESSGMLSAVQIFTFSDTTLTRRGVMNHSSPVRRSFQTQEATASLSEEELALFDISSPDTPVELGRVALAPNHTDVFVFGDHLVRKADAVDWYRYGRADQPTVLEVASRRGDPSSTPTLARFEIPAGSQLRKVGRHLLVAINSDYVDDREGSWKTTLQVIDFENPLRPRTRGVLTTRALQPDFGGYGYGYGYEDGYYGGWYGSAWSADSLLSVGDSLAFITRKPEQKKLADERVCRSWPREQYNYTCEGREGARVCTSHEGYRECVTSGRQTVCEGSFRTCTWHEGTRGYECTDTPDIPVQETCFDREAIRWWNRFEVRVVNLSQPDAPILGEAIVAPRDEEAVSVLAKGSDLWLSFKKPQTIVGATRPYVRFFTRRIDLSRPSAPAIAPAVNVPGQLLAVDGSILFTRDQVWGEETIEAAVARVRLEGRNAVLEAHRRFPDAYVQSIKLDGAGHVLVSYQSMGDSSGRRGGTTDVVIRSSAPGTSSTPGSRIAILEGGGRLSTLSDVQVDSWATLRDARLGRALFQVPGGLLVYNLRVPESPWPQAYFPTVGWPSEIKVEGNEILISAGRYGIHRFGLDDVNLPQRR